MDAGAQFSPLNWCFPAPLTKFNFSRVTVHCGRFAVGGMNEEDAFVPGGISSAFFHQATLIMFEHVDAYPGDPILSLNENFQKDPRQEKINLSIGIYFDDDGRLPVMKAVREAEAAMLSDLGPKPYLPMSGLAPYRDAVQGLVFGEACVARTERRIATVQTLGGSGALRVGADFLKRYFPQAQVWVSDPTWENHRFIFERAGFTVNAYPYYDDATGGLKFDAMLAAIDALAKHSIVVDRKSVV